MDNIEIEKIWIDSDFFEVNILFISKNVSCNIKFYMQDNIILQLKSQIEDFVDNPYSSKILWEIRGEDSKEVLIESKGVDSCGHVALRIKVKAMMQYDKFAYDEDTLDDYNCCFTVETELGLLLEFGKKLREICDGDVSTKISLLN